MKLEVGMYVRTDLGNIGKIVEEYTHQNNKVSYPEPQEWVLDTGYVLNEAMMYNNEEILKASHNIIDLISRFDLVNGHLVICKMYEDEKDIPTIIKCVGDYYFKEEDIKSIVTKEQFEQMAYKVGE